MAVFELLQSLRHFNFLLLFPSQGGPLLAGDSWEAQDEGQRQLCFQTVEPCVRQVSASSYTANGLFLCAGKQFFHSNMSTLALEVGYVTN